MDPDREQEGSCLKVSEGEQEAGEADVDRSHQIEVGICPVKEAENDRDQKDRGIDPDSLDQALEGAAVKQRLLKGGSEEESPDEDYQVFPSPRTTPADPQQPGGQADGHKDCTHRQPDQDSG